MDDITRVLRGNVVDSDRLIRMRKQCGITQQVAATLAGISITTLSLWEHGHRHPDKLQTIGLIVLYNRLITGVENICEKLENEQIDGQCVLDVILDSECLVD